VLGLVVTVLVRFVRQQSGQLGLVAAFPAARAELDLRSAGDIDTEDTRREEKT